MENDNYNMENDNYNMKNDNYNMENDNYNMNNYNYNTENIQINYGTSYITNSIKGVSFSLNINNENITLNNVNGVITINDNLSVGIYNIILSYIKDDTDQNKIYNITILPNFFYDLNNINNNSTLIPILHPNIDGILLNIFIIDYTNNDIIINSDTGVITLNNLNIGIYLFTVTWTVNNISVSHLINFTIKPNFYYENNKKIIYYGDNEFSDKPIIDPKLDKFIISSDYKINNEGILDLSHYDVGEYNIKVILNSTNIAGNSTNIAGNSTNIAGNSTNIAVNTYYTLYVKPKINYDKLEYTCYAFSNFKIESPNVLQNGGTFSLLNYNNLFIIDEITGEIIVNTSSGIYELIIKYIKNNAYNTCKLLINIKPVFSYSNMIINSNDIITNTPLTNEDIEGTFNLIDNKLIEINKDSGVISINKLYPNIYNIKVEYIKSNIQSETEFKLEVYPVLIIDNYNLEIYPITNDYIITSNNKDVTIIDKTFNLDNIIIVGNYNIIFTLTINNMITSTIYNYSKLPVINYSDEIFYGIYNTKFISTEPTIIYNNGLYKLNENDNFIIDEQTGVITEKNDLNIDEYDLTINLNYLSFDIVKNIKVIIKPQLIIPEQNFIYSECKLSNIVYLPLNGIFTINNKDYNDLSFELEFNKLNVGTYNIEIGYTINNIKSIVNVPIIINKKKLDLDLVVEDKEFDNNDNVIIKCTNYSEILVNGNYIDINTGKNKIIIKDILLPNNLINNYYVDIDFIYGNILPKILYPIISPIDKEFDNNNIAKVNINDLICDSNEIIFNSYEAIYDSKNIGTQNITIKNIKLVGYDNYKLSHSEYNNYKLSHNEYNIIGNILPKEITVYYIAKDKIYDGLDTCIVSIDKIDGIIPKDKIYINIISSVFENSNIGLHNIKILDYEVLGINAKNYKITFINNKANIFPQKIELKIIADDKIYDNTDIPILRFISEYKVLSYDSNYNNKNIGIKKKIIVKNIILENNNYYVDDLVLFGNILPKMIDFLYFPNDKVYDGTTLCDGTFEINNYLNDDVNCIFNATHKNINSGIDKEILITNIKLIGNDSNNYKLNSVKSMNGIIHQKEVTCTFKNVDKMYDKTTLGFVKIDKIYGLIKNDNILIKNDNIQIISLDAQYEDSFIGNNKKIIIKNIELEPKLFNYYINDTYCIGNIILRELNIIFNNPIKIYDGLLDIVLSVNNIKNVLDNDNIYIKSVKSEFEDPNIGKNKIIHVSEIELNEYSSKYYYCKDMKIEGTIKEKFLNINFKSNDQEYEPNLIPILSYELDDPFLKIISYYAVYEKIDIGLQKIIISNIILGGKNANNYIVEEQIIYGNILPKNKELEFIINDKIYDGTTIANITCISDDTIKFDANYESCNIGNHKIIVNNIIQTSTNYIIKNEYIFYGNILLKELLITPKIVKIYDGSLNYEVKNNPEIKTCKCKFSSSDVGENIPVSIYNIIPVNSNYYIKDFETVGTIEPKEIKCEFVASDKIYDETNKVFFDKIYCKITILSFTSYYENINVGYRNIIVENIKLENKNYYCNNLVISSTIKPILLKIDFIINPKIYDKIETAIISSFKLLNCTEKIKLYSYSANYKNSNVGKQLVIISNLIISSENYYTDKYYTYGIINPRNVILNFTNTIKNYDGKTETYINLLSFENKILDDKLEIIYFNSEYETKDVNDNINIIINNIELTGDSINNYKYNKNIIIKGQIKPAIIDCEFKIINNTIVGKLIGLLNNDNANIINYISYKKNNNYYIENIILDGSDKNNYILPNKIYNVL